MRVWYTTVSGGDGSSHVEFFESQECILLMEQIDPEYYAMGEGGSYFDTEGNITFASSYTKIYTMEDVRKRFDLEQEVGG